MAKLTTAHRNKLKTSVFGLPKERKYPMNDRAHAQNAKARASQQEAKGNLSASQKATIDAKANRILYGSSKKPSTPSTRSTTMKKAHSASHAKHMAKARHHAKKAAHHLEKAHAAAKKEHKGAKMSKKSSGIKMGKERKMY